MTTYTAHYKDTLTKTFEHKDDARVFLLDETLEAFQIAADKTANVTSLETELNDCNENIRRYGYGYFLGYYYGIDNAGR